ncbi:DUF6975 family protein [Stakelama saccharophila]|uniref:Uncharacterized protein n=1 Tax=Stakelama saccharophila TaxID=3075605 RepID=A0ABZ0BDN5_9SPHN|nr:hypothetical protein [Stakelama sp. W311]WNO55028.1 hypothetical protein RPR59_07235 [Stakelama sp. W311]
MVSEPARLAGFGGAWETVRALVRADGTTAQPFVEHLIGRDCPARDRADAVHHLCALHGRYPGIIEHAADYMPGPPARDWLIAAANAFAIERSYLANLAAAAGPVPSTPGQAEAEAASAAQRHALDTLGRSERKGCALGAAVVLALEWQEIRRLLDAAALRLGVAAPQSTLPPEHEAAALLAALSDGVAIERAMLFGADQLLAQHRGLWALLEARAEARGID